MENIIRIKQLAEEDDENDIIYWASRSPQERIDAIEFLRNQAKVFNPKVHAGSQFRRVYRVIKKNEVGYLIDNKKTSYTIASQTIFSLMLEHINKTALQIAEE